MNRFTIGRDRTTGDFEVVLIERYRRVVVARNLRTRSHAEAARNFWRNKVNREFGRQCAAVASPGRGEK